MLHALQIIITNKMWSNYYRFFTIFYLLKLVQYCSQKNWVDLEDVFRGWTQSLRGNRNVHQLVLTYRYPKTLGFADLVTFVAPNKFSLFPINAL